MPDAVLISQLVRARIGELVAAGVLAPNFSNDRNTIAYLTKELTQAAAAAEPALYNQLVQSFTLPANEVMLREAREMATRNAAELVTNIAASDLRTVGETVARGLERGDGPRAIAGRLDAVRDLDRVRAARLDKYIADMNAAGLSPDEIAKRGERMKKSLMRERKETIARTETANALEEGNYIEAQAAGREYKATITQQDDTVSDVCLMNEADGWIPVGKEFSSGHMHAPHHPNCRCATTYATFPPDERDAARADARHERTKAARNLKKAKGKK